MPVYDKYDPISGGYRAPLNADLAFTNGALGVGIAGVKCCSINTTGKVVIGTAGQSGFAGVFTKNVPLSPQLGNIAGVQQPTLAVGGMAGDVVDIMTSGEIILEVAAVAGTKYYAKSDGTLSATATDGPLVGWTVEATRLIVRCVGAPIGSAT